MKEIVGDGKLIIIIIIIMSVSGINDRIRFRTASERVFSESLRHTTMLLIQCCGAVRRPPGDGHCPTLAWCFDASWYYSGIVILLPRRGRVNYVGDWQERQHIDTAIPRKQTLLYCYHAACNSPSVGHKQCSRIRIFRFFSDFKKHDFLRFFLKWHIKKS